VRFSESRRTIPLVSGEVKFIRIFAGDYPHRVATHLENLENLEKSGNSKVVREKSGKMEKVREKSGKLKFILDFERAEELKLQLLAACGPGLWMCSLLTLL